MANSQVLTIGSHDSIEGIGIQADIQTLSAFQMKASAIITSSGAHTLPARVISQQMDQFFAEKENERAVIKVGKLASCATLIKDIASIIQKATTGHRFVVDTVTISESTYDEDIIDAFRKELLPTATVQISSRAEAEELLGIAYERITTNDQMREAAKELTKLGAQCVLIKKTNTDCDKATTITTTATTATITTEESSHLEGVAVLYDSIADQYYEFAYNYASTKNIPIVDNALSTAVAACLARDTSVHEACADAMYYVNKAVKNSSDKVNLLYPLKAPWSGPLLKALKSSLPDGLWDRYIDHPFIRGIAKGILPKEAFVYYLKQDFLYLQHAARAAALAVNKCDSMGAIEKAVKGIQNLTDEVQHVHLDYCAKWGISKEEVMKTKQSVYNIAYTRFLLDKAASGDLLDARMAIAACMVGYHEIGLKLYNDPATKKDGNPYWDWIAQYASERSKKSYAQDVVELEELADKYVGSAERFDEICKTFEQATRLEIMFWEQYDRRVEEA